MQLVEVLGGVGLGRMRRGQQLPLAPAGSVVVAPGVDLLEVDAGGVVCVWGRATSCWDADDVAGRRLAAVLTVETGAAGHGEVAAAFAVTPVTLRSWRRAYAAGGVAALAPAKRGPSGPSKLTEDKLKAIATARASGASMDEVARSVGVSLNSVSRALRGMAPAAKAALETSRGPTSTALVPAPSTALVPLAAPLPRDLERQAARAGMLAGAAPVICEGASLPLAGALVILPALSATGLLECAAEVYEPAGPAFYGLASLVLTVVFAALVGEPRAEGMTRLDPTDVGRLLGLDRAPEVRTLRRRMQALATDGRSGELLAALARRHTEANAGATGVFYVDGHVRAYHGGADVPKAHLARMRLAMPAEEDTWIVDARGEPVLVWNAPPGASLAGELRRAAEEVRALVGRDARPTIAFDRGGWSPALFAELVASGFDILTYRKGTKVAEPAAAFKEHHFTDDLGRKHSLLLADRAVRIAYKHKRTNRRFACRQVTALDPVTGHQTQVLTTRADPDPAVVAHDMFSRWRIENFFRYGRSHYNLDGLDSYAKADDDLTRMVPNPAKRAAKEKVAEAKAALQAATETEGHVALGGGRTKSEAAEIATAFAEAEAELSRLEAEAKAIPARIPLGGGHPEAKRLDPERKRILDAVRLSTYNAESALVRLVSPHYARADDEARTLLREIYSSPADLQVIGDGLHVRINALSAPRRTRALAALCEELNATESLYPGTKLTLVYSAKNAPDNPTCETNSGGV
jgi:transposase-like protein